jgi:hypothetical protein
MSFMAHQSLSITYGSPSSLSTLAEIIHEGFKNTATKEDVAALYSEMNQKFEAVESRLGKIEHLLLEAQKRKIEHLETRMKKLADALAI